MTTRTRSSILAFILCIAMCLSFVACSSKSTTDKINSYIATIQDELDELNESMGDTMKIDVTARDNSLVYSYQYKIDLGMDNETVAGLLDAGLEDEKATFMDVLDELQDAAPGAESVIVEYLDSTGKVITSREFK